MPLQQSGWRGCRQFQVEPELLRIDAEPLRHGRVDGADSGLFDATPTLVLRGAETCAPCALAQAHAGYGLRFWKPPSLA